jgi:hypothetical protein
MKLIFENWRNYLEEDEPAVTPAQAGKGRSPEEQAKYDKQLAAAERDPELEAMAEAQPSGETQERNAAALFQLYSSPRSKRVKEIFKKGYEGSKSIEDPEVAQQFINYLVVKNKIFHNNYIEDYLGAGGFGFVVELDNDHALKIFVGSATFKSHDVVELDPSAKSDVERYKTSQEKAFKHQTATLSDLHVYEQGELKTPFKRSWRFVEMPKLKPLSSWMREIYNKPQAKSTGPFFAAVDLEIAKLKYLADDASSAENKEKDHTEEINKVIKYLPNNLAMNLFDQFKEMLKTKSVLELKDILSKNIGLPFGNERSGLPIIYDM